MNTKKPTHICVFCGANVGARPVYAEAARALGRQFASNGITLVYGGGGIGLMFEAARAANTAKEELSARAGELSAAAEQMGAGKTIRATE